MPSPVSPIASDKGVVPETPAHPTSTPAATHLNDDLLQDEPSIIPADLFQHSSPVNDGLPSPSTIVDPTTVDDPLSASINTVATLMSRYGVSFSTATSATAAYFVHIQPGLPILHPPTFSLDTTPGPLASIVVAIGIMYSPHATQQRATSDRMRQDSFNELEALVSKSLWNRVA